MYARRRELQLERLEARALHRETKARFIRDVVAGAFVRLAFYRLFHPFV
jgi:hypothetical protein